jgi:hypothetical protein
MHENFSMNKPFPKLLSKTFLVAAISACCATTALADSLL